jgi:hypothetical protein
LTEIDSVYVGTLYYLAGTSYEWLAFLVFLDTWVLSHEDNYGSGFERFLLRPIIKDLW